MSPFLKGCSEYRPNMKYSFLIFDADGTLFDFDRAEAYALKETLVHFRMPSYDEEHHLSLYKEINHEVWSEFERGEIAAEKLKADRFRRMFARLGTDTIDPDACSRFYLQVLSTCTFLIDGAVELIDSLDGSMTLCLLTNGLSSVQHPRFKASPVGSRFPHIVVSEDVGVAKPNPEIFQIAFDKAGWKDKKSALMIGDSLQSDIKGGINFSIDTCWLNPKKLKNSTDIAPTFEIHALGELLETILQDESRL